MIVPLSVVAETTAVAIGSQVINVSDVVVTELQNNALGYVNDGFSFTLTEFNIPVTSNLRFAPITQANIIAPNMTVAFVSHQGQRLGFRITNRPAGNSMQTFTLTGVTVWADHTVPAGTFGIAVTNGHLGNPAGTTSGARQVLQNNFNYEDSPWSTMAVNQSWITAASAAPVTGTVNLDRFTYFGFQEEDFIRIGVGGTAGLLGTPISFVARDGVTQVTVNGQVQELRTSHGDMTPIRVINDRSLMPLRTLAEFMGAQEQDFVFTRTVFMNHVVDTTILNLGGREVMFFIGTPWYTVDGGAPRMMPSEVETQIINDRTYVSFRGFGEAFGIPVAFDYVTYVASFN
jgi:hypothetical protein